MKKVLGISIILFWFFRPFLFQAIGIDFTKEVYAENFRHFWLILIPLAILLIVYDKWKKNNFKSTAPIVLIACSLFFIFVSNGLSNFCGWRILEPEYIHKSENKMIQYRELNCGAGDTHPNYILVETSSLTKFFYKYEEVDISNINLETWSKN